LTLNRVLYLAPERPDPPTSGGRLHVAMLSTGLREHMDVVVLTPHDTDSEFPGWAEAVQRLKARRRSQLRRMVDTVSGLATGRHIVLERSQRSGLPEAFAEVVRAVNPSLVVLGRPYFGSFIDVAKSSGAAVIVDADESLVRVARSVVATPGPLLKRMRALVDLAVVGRMERREYSKVDQVWVISEIERKHFLGYLAPERVVAVPHVLPMDQWTQAPASAGLARAVTGVNAVSYVGWYGYAPNEAAALVLANEIMPRVRALGGPRKLVLIGRDPTARMRRLALNSDVTITGEVPDVIAPMRDAGLLAVPLQSGGGVRVKILEAAAAGVPVVSTHFGIEGLGLDSGEAVLIADEWDGFAKAIVRVAADADLRSEMTTRALALLMEAHSPASLAAVLGKALAGLGLTGLPPCEPGLPQDGESW
jgi:glycosyltransferase involved in cell wall biosynthesis